MSAFVKHRWTELAVTFIETLLRQGLEYSPSPVERHIEQGIEIFHGFYFPLFEKLKESRDTCLAGFNSDECESWQRLWSLCHNLCVAILASYLVRYVGREPSRYDMRRYKLDGACKCPSCRIVSRFLVDSERRRQIFPVSNDVQQPQQQASRRDVVVAEKALEHIATQLDHPSRDCMVLVKEVSSLGRVLLMTKRTQENEWNDWAARRDRAKERVKTLSIAYFSDILPPDQMTDWLNLTGLARKAKTWSLPLIPQSSRSYNVLRATVDAMREATIPLERLGYVDDVGQYGIGAIPGWTIEWTT